MRFKKRNAKERKENSNLSDPQTPWAVAPTQKDLTKAESALRIKNNIKYGMSSKVRYKIKMRRVVRSSSESQT